MPPPPPPLLCPTHVSNRTPPPPLQGSVRCECALQLLPCSPNLQTLCAKQQAVRVLRWAFGSKTRRLQRCWPLKAVWQAGLLVTLLTLHARHRLPTLLLLPARRPQRWQPAALPAFAATPPLRAPLPPAPETLCGCGWGRRCGAGPAGAPQRGRAPAAPATPAAAPSAGAHAAVEPLLPLPAHTPACLPPALQTLAPVGGEGARCSSTMVAVTCKPCF